MRREPVNPEEAGASWARGEAAEAAYRARQPERRPPWVDFYALFASQHPRFGTPVSWPGEQQAAEAAGLPGKLTIKQEWPLRHVYRDAKAQGLPEYECQCLAAKARWRTRLALTLEANPVCNYCSRARSEHTGIFPRPVPQPARRNAMHEGEPVTLRTVQLTGTPEELADLERGIVSPGIQAQADRWPAENEVTGEPGNDAEAGP